MTPNPYQPSDLPADSRSPASAETVPTTATRLYAVQQFIAGATAGFCIWWITAPREAWDANPIYSVFVLLAGAISSLLRFRGCWWGVLGVYFGQVAGLSMLVPHTGVPIFPAWLGVLICGTIQSVVGAALGGVVGYVLLRTRRALDNYFNNSRK